MVSEKLKLPLLIVLLQECFHLRDLTDTTEFDRNTLEDMQITERLTPFVPLLASVFGVTHVPLLKRIKAMNSSLCAIKLLRQLLRVATARKFKLVFRTSGTRYFCGKKCNSSRPIYRIDSTATK